MSTQIQRRRGTTAQHTTFTGVEGELTVDTTKDTVVVHDGATVGGHPLQKQYPALGSAAAPTYTFTGDLNTGIYSPGADQVAISTNGTGRLFVDADGRVRALTTGLGINRISQNGFDLDVGGLSILRGTVYVGGIEGISGDTSIAAPGGQSIIFKDGSVENARIDSSGRLGLGTSSPDGPLHISSTNSLGVQIHNPTATTGAQARLYLGAQSLLPRQRGVALVGELNADTSHNMQFWVSATGGAGPAEMMRLTNSGRLGIGTTSPATTLDVNGDVTITDKIIHGGDTNTAIRFPAADTVSVETNGSERARIDSSGRLLVGTSSGSGDNLLQIQGSVSGAASGVGAISLRRGIAPASTGINTTLGRIDFGPNDGGVAASIVANADQQQGTSDYPGRLVFSTTADGASSPTERMRITNTGLVGLGVTAPSARLTVLSPDTTGGVGTGSTIAIPASNGAAPLVINYNSIATDSTQALRLGVGTTERVRIGTAGILSSFNDSGDSHQIRSAAGAGTTDKFVVGVHGASSPTTGGITSINIFTNGNITNTNNSYAGISDIKLKENIIDASSQWEDLKALQVRKYNFKEKTGQQTHTQIGLVAQEAELVSPGLVSESPDRDEEGNDLGTVTKSVNYSVLYMKAVKALQEAMERIETLEAKVAALEGV
jgi:hypothetical protein